MSRAVSVTMDDLMDLIRAEAYAPRVVGEYTLGEMAMTAGVTTPSIRKRIDVMIRDGRVSCRVGYENGRRVNLYRAIKAV